MEAGANIGAILVRCILLYYGITFGISLCITSSSRRRHKRPPYAFLSTHDSGRQPSTATTFRHKQRLRMFRVPPAPPRPRLRLYLYHWIPDPH